MSKSFPVLCAVFCVCLFCACRENNPQPQAFQADLNVEYAARNSDNFSRAITTLNSLEDLPCLPNTPSYDKLLRAADHLNKWIKTRKPDEFWQPDPLLSPWNNLVHEAAENAQETVRLLWFLQGRDENGEDLVDEQGQPLPIPQSMDSERKQMAANLKKLAEQLRDLETTFDCRVFSLFASQVDQHGAEFERLEALPNLNALRLRNYAKQWDASRLLTIADALEKFAHQSTQENLSFQSSDAEYLKQCFWARGVSRWACGENQQLLQRAYHLFDWTVCNIDTQEDHLKLTATLQLPHQAQMPWQALLLSRSGEKERIWVFIELLRQQRIDACLLVAPLAQSQDAPSGTVSNTQEIWGVGVLLEGEIYVFLPQYGIPLPGPEGYKLAESGELTFPQIATLKQAQSDDSLFRQLDISGEQLFPVNSDMAKKSTLYLVALPESATMRMKTLEKELSVEETAVLFTDFQEQRKRFSEAAEDKKIEFWNYPYRASFEQGLPLHKPAIVEWLGMMPANNALFDLFMRPHPSTADYPIWTGRLLYLKGKITGQESAAMYYQNARVSDSEIFKFRETIPEFRSNPLIEQAILSVNSTANHWLGLASFERNSLLAAREYLKKMRLDSANLWYDNNEYVLGRIAEREKNDETAESHYASVKANLNKKVAQLRRFLLQKASN